MHKFFRFLYLNTYSFLLLFGGLVVILLPFYKVSVLLLIPQFFLSILFFKPSIKLFSSWKDKKLKYKILMGKNKSQFRPDSFEIFMKAPCGRLLTKAVLKDLGMSHKYKELLVYKESFFVTIREGCKNQETKIYINEEF